MKKVQLAIRCASALAFLAPLVARAEEPGLAEDAGVPVISWEDAGKYVGKDVILQGTIVETGSARTISFLNFDRQRSVTAIIRKKNYRNFPKDVRILYANKIVRIRGRVSEYKGKPQIEVYKPDQITVLAEAKKIAPPPKAPAREFTGVVTLATYNVLNLFDAHDDPFHDDEGTAPKPMAQLEKLAQTIHKTDADVLAMQEVENRGYLEKFVAELLPDMGYKHVVCYESNDARGIDCAVLSRLPVGPVTSYRHLSFADPSGGTQRFRRDLIQVRIEPPAHESFDMFVVHLKSKRGDSDDIRSAETGQARRTLDGVLRQDPDARFVICGDFNDTWNSAPMKILRGEGATALKSFHDDLPKGAVSFSKPPYRSVIDFILCSPAMARLYVPKSCRIVAGTVQSSGSDHNPVLVRFSLTSQ